MSKQSGRTHNGSLVAVVTGASSGIGEATATRLAREPGASLVLVARREERLRTLAQSLAPASSADGNEREDGGRISWVAADLTDEDAPERVRAHVAEHHGGRLTLLVNNAGASWRKQFSEGGYENVRRTMAINFDAQVRITEALLEMLRASAPSAIVNVASIAARVPRKGSGAYCASKAALASWSDSLALEERAHGVLPGFISTEGFPQAELVANRFTRWAVSTPEHAAEAIYQTGVGRRPERSVPRPYALASASRILAPGLLRRVMGSGGAAVMTTTTGPDMAERGAPAERD